MVSLTLSTSLMFPYRFEENTDFGDVWVVASLVRLVFFPEIVHLWRVLRRHILNLVYLPLVRLFRQLATCAFDRPHALLLVIAISLRQNS